MNDVPFVIEKRGPYWVLDWSAKGGFGCRTATDAELLLWKRLRKAEEDAKRYRWLASRKTLALLTDGSRWTTASGKPFICSHYLAAESTQHEPGHSLDEIIDKAMSNELLTAQETGKSPTGRSRA